MHPTRKWHSSIWNISLVKMVFRKRFQNIGLLSDWMLTGFKQNHYEVWSVLWFSTEHPSWTRVWPCSRYEWCSKRRSESHTRQNHLCPMAGVAKLWLASRMRLFEPLHAALWSFRKIISLFFIFYFYYKAQKYCKMLLPYCITFASRSKKNYDVTEAMACREGEWSDGPGHPSQGASKEWNYKN